jgi:single-strand selective monofunctional uracil DNA glycosylase
VKRARPTKKKAKVARRSIPIVDAVVNMVFERLSEAAGKSKQAGREELVSRGLAGAVADQLLADLTREASKAQGKKGRKAASSPLIAAAERLHRRTMGLRFRAPVAYVYTPLGYAWPIARSYLERYGGGPKEVVFVGMNPGPFGMAQTGVPFGEIKMVRDWMGLEGKVTPPAREHPKRPVLGLDCPRSEVSGARLWGAFARRFADPADFFRRAFVLNYCPLLFMAESGANITPDKLRADERAPLEAACDEHLAEALRHLAPRIAVGVGQYATKKLESLEVPNLVVATIPHPSPASPAANRGWDELARKALREAGIDDLI